MQDAAVYVPAGYKWNPSLAYPNRKGRATSVDQVVVEETALVLQATKHDHRAFVQLYDRFVDRIYRYVYFKVGSSTDAEDLTAQVFLRAWEAIGKYQVTGRPFTAWLYRIAHNLIVDHHRARRETVSLEETSPLEAPGTSLEEITQQHVNSELLRQALRRLTPDQQEVLLLRFLEGYSVAEVAQMMGRSRGAIRTLQHRALAALNRVLKSRADRL